MIPLLLLTVSASLILLTGRREKKRMMTALAAVIFLFMFSLLTLNPLPFPKTTYILDEPANFVRFKDASKYDKASDFFSSLSPLLLTSDVKRADIKEDGTTFGYSGLRDIGIDTAFYRSETLLVRVFSYNSNEEDYRLSLFESGSQTDAAGNGDSTFFFFPVKDADSVILTFSDDNQLNNAFFFSREKSILILSSSYTQNLQRFSMNLSLLFDSVEFFSGISDGKRTVSLKKNCSGIILADNAVNGDSLTPAVRIPSLSLDNSSYKKINGFSGRLRSGPLRLRRPFNPEKKIEEGLPQRLFSHALRGFPGFLSFAGFLASIVLLF